MAGDIVCVRVTVKLEGTSMRIADHQLVRRSSAWLGLLFWVMRSHEPRGEW